MSDESNTLDLTNVPDNDVEEEQVEEEEEEEEEQAEEQAEEEEEQEGEEEEGEEEEEEQEGEEQAEQPDEGQAEEEEEQAEEEEEQEEEEQEEEGQEEEEETVEDVEQSEEEEAEPPVEETVEDVEEEEQAEEEEDEQQVEDVEEQKEESSDPSELTDDLKQRIAELDYLRECCGNWVGSGGRGCKGRKDFLTAWQNKSVSVDATVNYEDVLVQLEKLPEIVKLWAEKGTIDFNKTNYFKNIESYTLEKPLFNGKNVTEKVEVVEQLINLLTDCANGKISVTQIVEVIDNLY